MKTINTLKKVSLATLLTFVLSFSSVFAQTDTMYIMKAGAVVGKYNVNTQVDSVIFYKPTSTPVNPVSIEMVNIPAGTFTMGSPTGEVSRSSDETQYSVTLSAFRMSKYEVTNAQYAAFLNAKGIGSNGLYAAGAYPTLALIFASSGSYDWGLHYNTNKWEPVAGYENNPVINVTWYGATEFATYAGGTLPTEAQWEYACRAGTTTPFNTGNFLTNEQANYSWAYPYNGSTNTVTTYPGKTQAVGTYPANAWGLHDMHGNVWEWCSDRYGTYPTTAQTNPTGAASGWSRVIRGGGWNDGAWDCRSADRRGDSPDDRYHDIGFRVVLVP
jgi:sulfatase modifying factor 1